jgi:hypothetical protein
VRQRDPLDDFRDLAPGETPDLQGDHYPGSKQVRASRRPPPPVVAKPWDAHPVILTVEGVETEMFDVGHLGKAMNGRSGAAMRQWEFRKYIPPADYRFPGKVNHGGTTNAEGLRRLYTREQVEGMVAIAKEEKVWDGTQTVAASRFAERVKDLFASGRRQQ